MLGNIGEPLEHGQPDEVHGEEDGIAENAAEANVEEAYMDEISVIDLSASTGGEEAAPNVGPSISSRLQANTPS